MPLFQRAYAWISGAAGACAFLIAALWYARIWDDGLQVPPPLPDDLTDLDALFSLQRAGILFQFGVPLLSVPAVLFGLLARKHWVSKIGLLLAAIALVLYLVYVRSCAVSVRGVD